MTKKLLLLLPLLLLTACSPIENVEGEQVRSEYYMEKTESVLRGSDEEIQRLENKEVVCYTFDNFNGGGISCFPKPK